MGKLNERNKWKSKLVTSNYKQIIYDVRFLKIAKNRGSLTAVVLIMSIYHSLEYF